MHPLDDLCLCSICEADDGAMTALNPMELSHLRQWAWPDDSDDEVAPSAMDLLYSDERQARSYLVCDFLHGYKVLLESFVPPEEPPDCIGFPRAPALLFCGPDSDSFAYWASHGCQCAMRRAFDGVADQWVRIQSCAAWVKRRIEAFNTMWFVVRQHPKVQCISLHAARTSTSAVCSPFYWGPGRNQDALRAMVRDIAMRMHSLQGDKWYGIGSAWRRGKVRNVIPHEAMDELLSAAVSLLKTISDALYSEWAIGQGYLLGQARRERAFLCGTADDYGFYSDEEDLQRCGCAAQPSPSWILDNKRCVTELLR